MLSMCKQWEQQKNNGQVISLKEAAKVPSGLWLFFSDYK